MKNHREHILDLPDTYIGSIRPVQLEDVWTCTWNADDAEPIFRSDVVEVCMGFYKICDEILVNALDQVVRTRANSAIPTKNIWVSVTPDGAISVSNDGEGIPVVEHSEHKMYIPDMIFGKLLTSGNYTKGEERIVGGKNGYGAKLANIYSLRFKVETVDSSRQLKYSQTWINNMSEPESGATITTYKKKPFTRITFTPDYARFNMSGLLDASNLSLILKRVVDLAGCTPPDVKVWWNDRLVPCKNLESYARLFVGSGVKLTSEKPNDRWEVVVAPSPDSTFRQVSFVNGVCTLSGGRHVEHVVNAIAKRCAELLASKKADGGGSGIRPHNIRNNMWVFIKCSIVNPSFASQTKETLTTPVADFGSRCDLSEAFFVRVSKTDVGFMALNAYTASLGVLTSKTDGKRVKTLTGIPKLLDANWAGTAKSGECTLVLTEGDSAKAMVVSALSVVGNDRYGVYPLRGKLNNLNGSSEAVACGKEMVQELKKIIGLQSGAKAGSIELLRYGRVLLMTDQDKDGSHIKGLLINLFGCFWPELLRKGMVATMYTPQVKVSRGSNLLHTFYSQQAYDAWKGGLAASGDSTSKYNVKYYKGLGTSSKTEAKEYFKSQRVAVFTYDNPADHEALSLAFDKKMSGQRKAWLATVPTQPDDYFSQPKISVHTFVHEELVHYSIAANVRAIPSFCDGLKPSQRKAIYGMIKARQYKDMKVAQLANMVSNMTAYHHGEVSMANTMVALAQRYVGSNNVNYLQPEGQFGTRIAGGKDASSVRYIFTRLAPITEKVFVSEDSDLLNLLDDDGIQIEPAWMLPVVPALLLNGSSGIGTGHSTHIPPFHPIHVATATLDVIEGRPCPPLTPWFRGFKGTVVEHGRSSFHQLAPGIPEPQTRFTTRGVASQPSSDTIRITELPIQTWTSDYEAWLEKTFIETGIVKSVKRGNSTHDDEHIDLYVQFKDPVVLDEALVEQLKLVETTSCSMANMKCFSPEGNIISFSTPAEYICEFVKFRRPFYKRRRDDHLVKLDKHKNLLESKMRFVQSVSEGTFKLFNRNEAAVHDDFVNGKYYCDNGNYDYLLDIPVKSFTARRVESLRAEIAKTTNDYDGLLSTTPDSLWKNDILSFIEEAKRSCMSI